MKKYIVERVDNLYCIYKWDTRWNAYRMHAAFETKKELDAFIEKNINV